MTFQTWAVLLIVALCLAFLLRGALADPGCGGCKGRGCSGRHKGSRRKAG